MALKKYTREVAVTLLDASTVTFTGDDGFAAYNALIKHEQIVADNKIIPYHAVVKAVVTNGSEDAEMAIDAACINPDDK